MKKMLALSAVLAIAGAASAGLLVSNEVTVASGETTAETEITLNFSGSPESPAIDRVVVSNASGAGTGTVSFAAVAAGVSVAIASTNGIVPSGTAALWPRREYTVGDATNAEPYTAHRLRVTVTQGAVSGDTVYSFGAIVR